MRTLLGLCCLAIVAADLHAQSALASLPNIVMILTDDQGYGELSFHGNPILRTPNLDEIAKQSVRFTNFHVAPMCTPTRAQLMTGLDATRTNAVNVSSGRTLLRQDVRTMPELLRNHGYTTGLFGKWHLGDNIPYRPQDRGFDETVTFPSSHIGSTPDHWLNDYFDDVYLHNGEKEQYQGYTTDVFFDEAIRWIRDCKANNKPFFTYIATAAPHQPHYVPLQYREEVQARLDKSSEVKLPQDPKIRRELISYLAMIENVDMNIGRLETFLKEQGLFENTLFIFLTDNGTTFGDVYYPCGMRGRKASLWEGGHRVPLFVRWPSSTIKPTDVTTLTQVQDLLPTILDLVGAEPNGTKFDGQSLRPLLEQKHAPEFEDRRIFINYSRMPLPPFVPKDGQLSDACTVRKEGAAVLWKNWRLLENRELYDLNVDPLQATDCAAQNPEVVKLMRESLDNWWKDIEPTANEAQFIPIGREINQEVLLSACEWWNVFIDQQAQVRRGELKNSYWNIDIQEDGAYEFELRRWPRESNLTLRAAAPKAVLADGQLDEGMSLDIQHARIEIDSISKDQRPTLDQQSVRFLLGLTTGKKQLKTTFLDSDDKELSGAYFVYVKRIK